MKKIGIATIEYDRVGSVTKGTFDPDKDFGNVDIKQLLSIKASKDVDVVKRNAETVLASWFSKINEVELADRDQYEVASEVLDCKKYVDGKVKKCSIQFYLKEVK